MLSFNNFSLLTFERGRFKIFDIKNNILHVEEVAPLNGDTQLGNIIAGAISPCNTYVCISDDYKRLMLYRNMTSGDLIHWELIRKCTLDRRCSNIKFSLNMSHIITTDKSGYLLRIPLEFEEIALNNEENRLKWVALGHISMLIDFDLHPQQKLIATSDRDEKIRLSHYPNCNEIYTFLLGHSKYVTQVAFSKDGRVLYSAAADGYVILWDLCTKNEIHRHKYYSGDVPESDVPVVTRMFVNDDTIFLFFKSQMYAEIITVDMQHADISSTSRHVSLDLLTVDAACIASDDVCTMYVMGHGDTCTTVSTYRLDLVTKHLSEPMLTQLTGDKQAYSRNQFLDSLAKAPADKSGLEMYYGKKEKRMKGTEERMSEDDEDD